MKWRVTFTVCPVVLDYLGTGMMVKVLKQTAMWHVSSEVLKMSVTTGDS